MSTSRKSTARPRRRRTPRSPSTTSTRGRRSHDARSASPRRLSHTGSSGSPESHTQGVPSSRSSEPRDRPQDHPHPPRDADDDDDDDDVDGADHLQNKSDDDEDSNMGSDNKKYIKTSTILSLLIPCYSLSRHHYIRLKGRIFGRYRCMWTPFSIVFEEGLSRLPQEDPNTLPRRHVIYSDAGLNLLLLTMPGTGAKGCIRFISTSSALHLC